MRDDAISRKAAIDAFDGVKVDEENGIQYDVGYNDGIDFAVSTLSVLPSVQPERKIGRWFVLDECTNEGVYCSECHKKVFKIDYSNTMKWKNFKFCPHCGADMRGEEDGH